MSYTLAEISTPTLRIASSILLDPEFDKNWAIRYILSRMHFLNFDKRYATEYNTIHRFILQHKSQIEEAISNYEFTPNEIKKLQLLETNYQIQLAESVKEKMMILKLSK